MRTPLFSANRVMRVSSFACGSDPGRAVYLPRSQAGVNGAADRRPAFASRRRAPHRLHRTELFVVELAVDAAARQQLGMAADFTQPPIGNDDDAVGIDHRGEAVGNDE